MPSSQHFRVRRVFLGRCRFLFCCWGNSVSAMGALFSFFRKKKVSACEMHIFVLTMSYKVEPTDYAQILDKIAAEIEEHKKRKTEFLASYKRAISQLLIGFCVVELLLVIWYYFHQKPSEILDHLLHVLPLLLVPVL